MVYDNKDHYVDLKNLEISTTYYTAVFEYNAGSDNKTRLSYLILALSNYINHYMANHTNCHQWCKQPDC